MSFANVGNSHISSSNSNYLKLIFILAILWNERISRWQNVIDILKCDDWFDGISLFVPYRLIWNIHALNDDKSFKNNFHNKIEIQSKNSNSSGHFSETDMEYVMICTDVTRISLNISWMRKFACNWENAFDIVNWISLRFW